MCAQNRPDRPRPSQTESASDQTQPRSTISARSKCVRIHLRQTHLRSKSFLIRTSCARTVHDRTQLRSNQNDQTQLRSKKFMIRLKRARIHPWSEWSALVRSKLHCNLEHKWSSLRSKWSVQDNSERTPQPGN